MWGGPLALLLALLLGRQRWAELLHVFTYLGGVSLSGFQDFTLRNHSRWTSGDLWDARQGTRISHMQGQHSPCCSSIQPQLWVTFQSPQGLLTGQCLYG